MQETELLERIAELERRLEDLKKRLPAHSIPPPMLLEMEELEDRLAALHKQHAGELQLPPS